MTNPALADLEPLVGRWRMELYNASFLDGLDARVSAPVAIEWIEDGSALRMREKSADQGATWEHDFNVDYVRERDPAEH